MTTSTKKTQDKQHVLQEARKAAALMERLVLQYKDEPNWLELVAAKYAELMERPVLQYQDEPNYLEIVAANIKKKGIKRITVQMEQI